MVRGDKVVARGVTGVRRQGAADKIEPDDRFHIASCTKSMTATTDLASGGEFGQTIAGG
ncbi:MAG: serine hydrolase [Blastocatellia bacterium]